MEMADETAKFMQRALDLCREKSKTEGNPIASIITKDGEIIAEGWNGIIKHKDPSLHAEVDAIRKACQKLQCHTLEGCDLYTTLEPCAMCTAVLFYSKVRRVIYASSLSDIKHLGDYSIVSRETSLPPEQRAVPYTHLTSAVQEGNEIIFEWVKEHPEDPFSKEGVL